MNASTEIIKQKRFTKTVESLPVAGPQGLEATVVRQFTAAPLRLSCEAEFDAEPKVLFNRVSEPSEIAKWFAMIRRGETNHSTSSALGEEWGAGSTRTCYTNGMGTLYETIRYWDAPHAYAYEVKNLIMPVRNHLALMRVVSNNNGGSKFLWNHYFDFKGVAMRYVFPAMMATMVNQGMKKLSKELGGPGGHMRVVKV
ncbi:MAG: SRPBCC family protein [Granulosicoccus sp.]